MAKQQVGKDNPCWHGGKSQYYCMACGKSFVAYSSEYGRGGARFCSYKCGYEYKQRRTTQVCGICRKEFEAFIYDVERGKANFCSRECSGKWRSETYRGENHHTFGKTFSEEHREKIGAAHRGEKSYRWKGGITPENRKIRNSTKYKMWQVSVFERDNYTCQECKRKGGYLHAHHILSFAMYLEKRFDIENGLTLCKTCHDSLTYCDMPIVNIAVHSEQSNGKHALNSVKPLLKERGNTEPIPSNREGVEHKQGASLMDEDMCQTTNGNGGESRSGMDPRLLYIGNT